MSDRPPGETDFVEYRNDVFNELRDRFNRWYAPEVCVWDRGERGTRIPRDSAVFEFPGAKLVCDQKARLLRANYNVERLIKRERVTEEVEEYLFGGEAGPRGQYFILSPRAGEIRGDVWSRGSSPPTCVRAGPVVVCSQVPQATDKMYVMSGDPSYVVETPLAITEASFNVTPVRGQLPGFLPAPPPPRERERVVPPRVTTSPDLELFRLQHLLKEEIVAAYPDVVRPSWNKKRMLEAVRDHLRLRSQ